MGLKWLLRCTLVDILDPYDALEAIQILNIIQMIINIQMMVIQIEVIQIDGKADGQKDPRRIKKVAQTRRGVIHSVHQCSGVYKMAGRRPLWVSGTTDSFGGSN